jgi:hypothetical protein
LSERTFDLDVWAARLRDFLNDCVASAACEEADRVREAGLLLQGTPLSNGAEPDFALIEAMLGCGAAESAALTILGSEVSFMLSRSAAGSCLATVVARDESEEMILEGATVALALLAAHASLLISRLNGGVEALPATFPSSARLH